MPIDAARLRIIIEAKGVKEAGQQLQALGSQLNAAGKQSEGAAKGLAALDKHALNAKQRAERLGAQLEAQAKAAESASKGLEKAGAAADKAGKSKSKAAKETSVFSHILGDLNAKSLLTAAGLAGLGFQAIEVGKAAIRAGIQWESAFAGVEKTVDGTKAELNELSIGIRDLAREIPVSAIELAGLAEAAGQLGVARENILEFTRVTAMLGVTTDISSDQAATSLGQLQNVLGLTADEYERFGSALVAVGNDGASTESAILGITTRMGAAAKLIGLTTDQTLGWSAAIANLGLEIQAAGGAAQVFFVKSAQMINAGGKELEEMARVAGMTGAAFRQAFAEDSSAALQTFIEGLGKMSQAQQLATLAALGFTEINIQRTILGLANSNDNLSKSLDTTALGWEKNAAMSEEAAKRFKTTESQLQLMKNHLNDIAYSLFTAGEASGATTVFFGSLVASADGLANVARSVQLIGDAANALPDVLPPWVAAVLEAEPRIGETLDRSIKNALMFGFMGPSVLMGLDWFGAGEKSGEDFGKGVKAGIAKGFAAFTPTEWLTDLRMDTGALDYGPFLEEVFIGPMLKLAPKSREYLKELFELDPSLASEWADQIAVAMRTGAVTLEEGLDMMAALPEEVITPALEGVRKDIIRELGEDAWDGVINEPLQRELALVDAALDATGKKVITAGGEFVEFATMGERAMRQVKSATEGLSDAVSGLSGAYSIGLDIQAQFTAQSKEYSGQFKTIKDAYDAVQEKVEKGIELTQDEILILEHGSSAMDTFTAAQGDATTQAGLAAIANARLVQAQWKLNEAIKNGVEDLAPYAQEVEDAKKWAEDMGVATDGNTEAQNIFAEALEGVVAKLRDLFVELGLLPPLEPEVDTTDADMTLNEFADKYGSMPEPPETVLSVDDAEALLSLNEYIETQGKILPSIHTEITAATDAAEREIERIKGIIAAGAYMPISIGAAPYTGTIEAYAEGGPVKETGIALVGEKGPELVVLPGGSEVIPNHMLPFLGGFAEGTIPDLTSTDRARLKILGDLELALSRDNIRQLEDELADLWDSRKIAEELGLGEAIIAQIDADIAAKQSELDLIGQIAGSSVGQGVIAGIESQRIGDMLAGTLDSILSDLDSFASGELARSLEAQIADLFTLSDIARQMGDDDLANAYMEQAWTLQEEWKRVMTAMGTDAGKALVEGFNVEAEWDQRMADLIAGPRAAENIQSAVDDLSKQIEVGRILGAPEDMLAQWEAERDGLIQKATTYWSDVAQAAAAGLIDQETLAKYAEAGGELLEAAIDGLMGEGALDAMLNEGKLSGHDAFEALLYAMTKTVADSAGELVSAAQLYGSGFVDDIIKGVHEGLFDVEQAYKLLAKIPVEQLAPALQQLENQWTQGLVKAIADGNLEMQEEFMALLEMLGMLRGEFGNLSLAASNAIKAKKEQEERERERANQNADEDGSFNSRNRLRGSSGRSDPWISRGAATLHIGRNRQFADGAIVTSPLTALVGEAGPEMVQPLSAGHPERQRLIDDVATAVVRQLGGNDRANFTVLLDSKPIAVQVGQTMHQGHKVKAGP